MSEKSIYTTKKGLKKTKEYIWHKARQTLPVQRRYVISTLNTKQKEHHKDCSRQPYTIKRITTGPHTWYASKIKEKQTKRHSTRLLGLSTHAASKWIMIYSFPFCWVEGEGGKLENQVCSLFWVWQQPRGRPWKNLAVVKYLSLKRDLQCHKAMMHHGLFRSPK